MNTPSDISDSDKKRIDILLKEYDTLRQEILARMQFRSQAVGMLAAITAAIAAFKIDDFVMRLQLLATGALFVVWIWYRYAVLIVRCHERVVIIEKKVNELAKADLMEWESNCTTGVAFSLDKPFKEKHSKPAVPPPREPMSP